jgi:hypothetical protein
VDVFATSACVHFLAAGLHDGSAQLVHVASRRILASFPLVSPPSGTSLPLAGGAAAEQATFAAVFFDVEGPEGDRLCLLTQGDGQLFIFNQLRLAALHQALLQGDLEALVAAKASITQTQVGSQESQFLCKYNDACIADGRIWFVSTMLI